MLVKEPYWFFTKIVPDHLCDHIIKYAYDKFTAQTALTHWDSNEFIERIQKGDPEALKEQYKIRRSSIVWLHDNWVYNLIRPAINMANKNANWNFIIDGFEQCQFTIYKENNYYDWHQDSGIRHSLVIWSRGPKFK